MKVYAIRIFVKDWEGLCKFYERILSLPLKFKDVKAGWAGFDVGGPSLAFERIDQSDKEARELVGRFLGISLRVKDIVSVHRQLSENGVEFIAPPEKQIWGGSLAHFKDPEGNILTILG